MLQLSSSVLDWFVKNKTERNSSQSKVTIVYSKATSPYQFLNSSNCTISIIALLKGSLKDRIPLRGLFFPINTTALLLAGFFKCYPRLPVHVKPKSNYTRAFICTRKCKLLFTELVHDFYHLNRVRRLNQGCYRHHKMKAFKECEVFIVTP